MLKMRVIPAHPSPFPDEVGFDGSYTKANLTQQPVELRMNSRQ
jgi:hypothetical protein